MAGRGRGRGQPSLTSFLKRPAAEPFVPEPKRAASGSAFVPCPNCGVRVALASVNEHLDACISVATSNSPAERATASDMAAAEAAPGPSSAAVAALSPSAAPAAATVWTIGHSNPSSSAPLLDVLCGNNVETLIDVRTVPRSTWLPHFCEGPLREACKARALRYEWHGQRLGGRFVAGGVEANLSSAAGAAALAALAARAAAGERLVLMCSEARWCDCHRGTLSRELVRRHGCTVLHLSQSAHSNQPERHPAPPSTWRAWASGPGPQLKMAATVCGVLPQTSLKPADARSQESQQTVEAKTTASLTPSPATCHDPGLTS